MLHARRSGKAGTFPSSTAFVLPCSNLYLYLITSISISVASWILPFFLGVRGAGTGARRPTGSRWW